MVAHDHLVMTPSPQSFRIGHGYDLHRLQSGGNLLLAGVVVSDQISPVAHSDGDVILHALVDALLGAMGWGDIGERFPDTDPKWKGAASRLFVESVYADVRAGGFELINLDVTLLAEKPKIKPFKPAMVAALRSCLHADGAVINVKAGTNEGCDAIGRGEAIAAHAVVLLGRTNSAAGT
jgi:2-C-methyl-D-erythritol 2,4-cyclodiphosphate synthase